MNSKVLKDLLEMFKGTDSMLNTKLVPSNISCKFSKHIEFTVPIIHNSYCDHRNFDNVNQPLYVLSTLEQIVLRRLFNIRSMG